MLQSMSEERNKALHIVYAHKSLVDFECSKYGISLRSRLYTRFWLTFYSAMTAGTSPT